ncbi:MAG: uncharacterized protein A8A55_2925 [Amphiamblys sp. WSBS2006]|nr:MAG: uncharacterized protein A8A55_2925 [Amphiamblys sp. WSBS2006]
MFDLVHGSFAKHGDRCFLEEKRGVLIISEALLEKKRDDIPKKGVLSALVPHLQRPDRFSLTCDLPNETVLLADQTTVTLSNIEISVKLFFVLLEKTRVTAGGAFSITEHIYKEDCIREHGMAREAPFWLERHRAVSSLALENIERMALSSIGCSLKKIDLSDTGLINILPKLGINEDSEVKDLRLSADKEAHVAAVLEHEKPFCVGRVKRMWLKGYAVGVLAKLRVHKDCEVESLDLVASEKTHVTAVLEQEKPFCVGRVKNMRLWDYAVCVVTKTGHEDCEVEYLRMFANKEAHVAGILKQEKHFCVGRVKEMWLEEYAVGVITKMSLKDCGVEDLRLYASEEPHVAAVLAQENPLSVGGVKRVNIWGYAVSVITKMTIHEDNTMESFVLRGQEDHFSKILGEKDRSIDLGRIRTDGLRVPERIKRKLRYTLVDGEGKEVLEEEEPGQRGNLLE